MVREVVPTPLLHTVSFILFTCGSNNTLYSTAHLHLFVVRVPKLYSTKYKFQNSLVFSLDCHRGTSAASQSLVHLAHDILDRNQHPVIIEHPQSQFTNITRQLLPSNPRSTTALPMTRHILNILFQISLLLLFFLICPRETCSLSVPQFSVSTTLLT